MESASATWVGPSVTCELEEEPTQAWLGRPRILVAEDDEDLARGLGWMLSQSYLVSTHDSALGVLQSCDRGLPDLLIIDYALPDLTGIDLFQILRGSVRIPLPAIMISAYEARAEAALRCGFDAFLSKPLREAELMRAVGRAIGA